MVRSSEWWPLSKLILSLSPKRTLVSSREWLFPGLHATTRPWTGAPGATGRGTDSSFIKSTCVFFGDFQWSNSFPKLDGWVNFYMSIDRCVVRAKLCHDSLAVATSTYQSLRPIFMCRAHVVQSLSWVFGYAYKYHVYIIFVYCTYTHHDEQIWEKPCNAALMQEWLVSYKHFSAQGAPYNLVGFQFLGCWDDSILQTSCLFQSLHASIFTKKLPSQRDFQTSRLAAFFSSQQSYLGLGLRRCRSLALRVDRSGIW